MFPNLIEDALHSLDPASPPADPHGPGARALLARISETEIVASHAVRNRRLTGAAALVVMAAAGVSAIPALTSSDAAFASWTAKPQPIVGFERDAVVAGCEGRVGDHAEGTTPTITESRGHFALVVMAGSDGYQVTCLGHGPDWSDPASWAATAGVHRDYTPPSSRGLVANNMGTVTQAAGDISLLAGVAGSDVTGVTYDSPSKGKVEATVTDGSFALWVPGDDMKHMEPTGSGPTAGVTVVATYRDGSTATLQLKL